MGDKSTAMGFLRRYNRHSKKTHTVIGGLNKKIFKYGCGRRIIYRTNWDVNTFFLAEDVTKTRQKTLCTQINNIKRAYELKISECIIMEHFKSVILLHGKIQKLIKYSTKLDNFCKTLAFPQKVEYIENLLAMFKKTEIAIAGSFRSISEFRLKAIKLKRALLSWWTLIKQSPDKSNTKQLEDYFKNDFNTLNLITHGELRGSEQRKEKLTNRLLNKYANNMNITTIVQNNTKRRKLNNFTPSYTQTNNPNNTNNNSYRNNNISNINDNNNNYNNYNQYELYDFNNSAIAICENMFDNSKIFNTGDNYRNFKRVEKIRKCISEFHKEDVENERNTYNNTSNRKRNFNTMNNNMDTNKNWNKPTIFKNIHSYNKYKNKSNQYQNNTRNNARNNTSNQFQNNKNFHNNHPQIKNQYYSNNNQFLNNHQFQNNKVNFHHQTPWRRKPN